MKKIHIYILMAAAFLSMAACSQDDGLNNSYLSDSDAVHITAQVGSDEIFGGFTTRSNPLGSEIEQTKFNEGDAINVVADNQEAVVYSFDGTNWSPKEKGRNLVWNSDEMTFKAFYPANANDASFTDFTLPAAYNSPEELALGDYMTFSGSRKRSSGNDGVSLEMERKMVRIVVDLRDENTWGDTMEEGLELTEVVIHPNTNGYFDGELVSANSEDVSVKAYKHSDGKFYALITPTLALPNSEMYNYLLFMTVKVAKSDGTGEHEFEVRRIPYEGLEAGNSYEYSLKIGKDALVIDKITVSDWTKGNVIPGGEALDDTEFIKKTIADALAANKTDIELTLNSWPESELDAIRDALKTTADGSINLKLKGITYFKIGLDNSINSCNKLKSITLPDVTEISLRAFEKCDKLEEIDAPNVSKLGSDVFKGCSGLKKITLGALTNVYLGSASETFSGVDTENVDLVLSKAQKQMVNSGNWSSSEDDYKSTDDYTNKIFLGRQFKSVTLQ